MKIKSSSILLLIAMFFSTQSMSETKFGISVGNVMPDDSFYGATFQLGLHAATVIDESSSGITKSIFGLSLPLADADTTIAGVEYGYQALSIGIAFESTGKLFFSPEFGFESVEDKLTGPGGSFSVDNSGVYWSLGVGYRYDDGQVGVLKYRPLGGEEDGFMWSWTTFF